MEKHYICLGGCRGVSKYPGVCQDESCANHKHELVECHCTDGTHNNFKPMTSEGKAPIVLILAVAAVVVAGALFLFGALPGKDAGRVDATPVVFTSPATGDTISVIFAEETAVLSGAGYTDLVFTQAVAASGARYVNEAEGLELWNRGEAITLSRGDTELFAGNVGGLTDADRLARGVWVWQATTRGDAVTEPRDADAFTLRFDAEAGMAYGTTDCNSFSGPYFTGADNALSFGPFTSTLMYCEGSQESVFRDAVGETTHFMFAGSGALSLELPSGSVLLGQQE